MIRELRSMVVSIVIGLVLGAGIIAVQAWTEPTQTAPGGNLGAPINTSINDQTKTGAFTTDDFLRTNARRVYWQDAYIYGDNSSALSFYSNNGAASQLLMRNDAGTAYGRLYGSTDGSSRYNFGLLNSDSEWSYQDVDDVATYFRRANSIKMTILESGSVGIGTTNPQATLDVNGDIISNGSNMWWLHTPDDGRTNLYFGRGSNGAISEWGINFSQSGNAYFMGGVRADGGFQTDGYQMISADGSLHSAMGVSNYGYFEGRRRSDGARGFYLGWGNGSSIVNLALETADYLDITGATNIRYLSPNAFAPLWFDNATSTKAGAIVYNGSNQFVLARYANGFGAWEASPFIFDTASGKLHVNGGGLQVNSLANCGSGGKLTTDASGNVICGTDATGSGRGINLTNCYNKSDNGDNDGWDICGSGEVMIGAMVSGLGCNGECVNTEIRCCRATVQ